MLLRALIGRLDRASLLLLAILEKSRRLSKDCESCDAWTKGGTHPEHASIVCAQSFSNALARKNQLWMWPIA